MSSMAFGWESLVRSDAPSGCSLKAALFTTYDRADERLLAEHLLPLFLKVSREPDGEGTERQCFILELDNRLKQLHDRLFVISSTLREEDGEPNDAGDGSYGWIWQSIRPLTVGSRAKAVQHAKVWLLHWGACNGDGVEYLEIVVTSANLTMNAFKGQLQAAWRACIELRPQRADARLGSWGVLPEFLRELARSAGDEEFIEPFVDLLGRATCPEGVSLLASVPGTHSRAELRRNPWGSAGLRSVTPAGRGKVLVSILSPYVGEWNGPELRRWCSTFDGAPERIELVWIDKVHPWARRKLWMLPKTALASIAKGNGTLLHLRHVTNDPENIDLFHEEHRGLDERWSHAKVYGFKRGGSRRLLVTSANFSTAAWGRASLDDGLTIENFELGVCIDPGVWPFDTLDPFDDIRDAFVSETTARGANEILWVQAVWDGKRILVECRCQADCDFKGSVKMGKTWKAVDKWTFSSSRDRYSAVVPWADPKRPPTVARLSTGHDTVMVAVFDARPAREREDTVPPEIDEDVVQAMRDQLLFERYGGRVTQEDDGDIESQLSGDDGAGTEADTSEPTKDDVDLAEIADRDLEQPTAGRVDSYAVPSFELARQHLRVVDKWVECVNRAEGNGIAALEREWLLRDGEHLVQAFLRQAERDKELGSDRSLGGTLAAEELTLRLKQFQEA